MSRYAAAVKEEHRPALRSSPIEVVKSHASKNDLAVLRKRHLLDGKTRQLGCEP
jgi:hypothetical protein